MGQALGGVVSAVGAQAEAEAAKNAAKFNARLSTIEAAEQSERVRAIGRQEASNNVTRIAKSGVRIEGSPLEVMAENAANVERQLQNIERGNFIKQISAQAQAKSARTSAKLAVASSVASTIGTVLSLGLGGGGGGGGSGGGSRIGGQTFGGGRQGGGSSVNGFVASDLMGAFNRRNQF